MNARQKAASPGRGEAAQQINFKRNHNHIREFFKVVRAYFFHARWLIAYSCEEYRQRAMRRNEDAR